MEYWTPSCVGKPIPGIKWRIMTDGIWFYIECKDEDQEQWEGGLAGTQAWLGLSDEEAGRAYPVKTKKK